MKENNKINIVLEEYRITDVGKRFQILTVLYNFIIYYRMRLNN